MVSTRDRLKAALKEIEDAKPRAVQIQASLDEIVTISRDLARTAIDEAIVGGGKASDIQKAREELAKGDTELAKGDYEKAADKFKKAFEEARDSL